MEFRCETRRLKGGLWRVRFDERVTGRHITTAFAFSEEDCFVVGNIVYTLAALRAAAEEDDEE